MVRLRLRFSECEHSEDVENYNDELRKLGAYIIDSDIDYEEEECTITIEVPDKEKFYDKFKQSDIYGFADPI